MAKDKSIDKTKKTTKREKKVVDPNKPKRPNSAYIRYGNSVRAEVKAANPTLKLTEISTVIGKMWKDLPEEKKNDFQKEYEKEKVVFDKKMEEYKKTHPEEKKTKQKKTSDPDRPKRALSAFFFFSNEKRNDLKQQYPDKSITELSTELGKLWKELKEEDKKPYDEKHDADVKRYEKEMIVYRKTHPEEKEKKEKKEKKSKPAKKPAMEEKASESEESNESEDLFDEE